jgi:hypothetical protein
MSGPTTCRDRSEPALVDRGPEPGGVKNPSDRKLLGKAQSGSAI